MRLSSTAKPPSPLYLRILLWAWLSIQGLLLLFILNTHGAGMEPDLRLLSGAAMVIASFPLSLPAMWVALVALENLSVHGLLLNGLITWASCFLAGAVELWLLTAFVRRLRATREKLPN